MKKTRLWLLSLLLLCLMCCVSQAAEPDWDAIRKNQAWYYAADGSVVAGKLSTIVKAWLKGEGKTDPTAKLTVYLCKDQTLKITKISRKNISRFKFKVDKTALPKAKKKTVQVSETDPDSGTVGISAGSEETLITAYIWLEDPETTDTMDSSGGDEDVPDAPGSATEEDNTPLTSSGSGSGSSSPGGGSFSGGSFGGGGRVSSHAKEKYQSDIGYDQVGINALYQEEAAAMSTLTLGGEEQPLSLDRNGQPAEFIPELIGWKEEEISSDDPVWMNTLLLQAVGQNDGSLRWTFSGELLRKLCRSGIEYLVLEAGDQALMLPTEGFLGGTRYDELKMRGTASSLFTYEIRMDGTEPVQMDVTVGAETFSVTADAESFLHWTDVRFLTGADLKKLNSLTRENG